MKIFIWNRVKYMSSSYHDDGAVVVCAESEQRAREMFLAESGCGRKAESNILTKTPDRTVECIDHREPEFIEFHNDAGCC